MSIVFTLLTTSPYLDFPQSPVGRLITACLWVAYFGLIVFLAMRGSKKNGKAKSSRSVQFWGIFAGLAIMIPLTSLFLGLRLPSSGFLPPPGLPVDPPGPSLMVFAAVPWMLAAGLLGSGPAGLLGGFSGLLLALWDTHSPFTPLELALLAVLCSAALNQRYRTFSYRLLRRPIFTALVLALLYPLIFLADTILLASGSLAIRLDFALTHLGAASLSIGGQLLLAGLFTDVVAAATASLWGDKTPLQPSLAEKSLEARFLYGMAPLAILLVLVLMIGNWYVAGSAARSMMQDRLANAAQTASRGVPYFLEAGQNLIGQLASDSQLYTGDSSKLTPILEQYLRRVPYFRQLYVLDVEGNPLAGYPSSSYSGSQAPPAEQMGVQLALNGVPFQLYTVPPVEGGVSAQVSYVAAMIDQEKVVHGVLIGRAELDSNPFTQPVLAGLKSLSSVGGQGILLDDNSQILYSPDASRVMTSYTGQHPEQPACFEDMGPDGTRDLIYYQPVEGSPWAIVLSVPAQRVQQLSLNIAAPLMGMILILFLAAVFLVRLGLRVIIGSMQKLAVEAVHISQGELDRPLVMESEDEVGQVGKAFEQMRIGLKARIDELNRLLVVSQGVASSLEIGEAVRPVLESALRKGACVARVVLSPAVVPELEGGSMEATGFGSGPAGDLYNELDEQILALTRQQDRIVMNSLARARLIKFQPDSPRPGSLLALALRHESLYYGALWVAYDEPHPFGDEEVRFLTTLASQSAVAAANARLFMNAEIGRQRLAAILASTPDPVLVIDQQSRLLLANPASWRVLGLGIEWDEGQPIEKVISNEKLITLLHSASGEKQSAEITLPDERVYYATTSPVFAEGRRVGQVCVLRDITYFKEVDALKSDFVATVSHDLRSPLTLMRGYATMLEMVGELNEQQENYVRKIVGSVENMARLVNNLLDLGRIEAGIGLQVEMVPVRDVIERVIGALQLQATQKRVQLVVDIPDKAITLLEADQPLLQQALHNLVENAIKYTEAGGKAQVRLAVRLGQMLFMVSDTGIGIAPVDQQHLFEKFYRGAQQNARQQRGTGLGLAIVKSIAERHGGRVWVESQLGKGSTFYLSIPLKQPAHTSERVKREA